MRHATVPAAVGALIIFLAVAGGAAAFNPTQLLLPQADAFSVLGHSCGGIQEQAYATGFTGWPRPRGDVHLQTRCGRYVVTTYTAWARAVWNWAGDVVAFAKLNSAPTVDPAFSLTDSYGNHLYNVSKQAYLSVPAAGAPTGVTAVRTNGRYRIGWTASPAGNPAVTSSTIKTTPVTSGPSFTTFHFGAGTSTTVGPLEPLTTYKITVASTDNAGTGPASAPLTMTTPASTVPPGTPTGLTAHWTAPGAPGDTLAASWNAAAPGDSPVNAYQVTIHDPDSGTTLSRTVSGSILTATFSVSDIPDWTVKVRAHNAAGWGPWTAPFLLGGV